jgi:calcineurin-like phosphoesterase family protein
VHGLFKTQVDQQGRLAVNVGVDVWDFKPVSLERIEKLIEGKNFT